MSACFQGSRRHGTRRLPPARRPRRAPPRRARPRPLRQGRRAGERSRVRSSSAETPPPAKVLQEKGKAEKDPEVCARIESDQVRAPGRRRRHQGRQERAGVSARAHGGQRRRQEGAAAAKTVEFDQKNCVFEPHVLGLMAGETVTLKSSDPMNHNVNVKLKNSDVQPDDRRRASPFRSPVGRRADARRRSSAIFIPG